MTSDIGALLANGTVTVILLAGVGLMAKTWIATRIKESIAAGYRQEHERLTAALRWDLARRERASLIADVVAAWIGLEYDPDKKASVPAYLDVQRRYLELALWLDTPALRSLNAALTRTQGADYKQAIAATRSLLVGEEPDPITAGEIVHFPLPNQATVPGSPDHSSAVSST